VAGTPRLTLVSANRCPEAPVAQHCGTLFREGETLPHHHAMIECSIPRALDVTENDGAEIATPQYVLSVRASCASLPTSDRLGKGGDSQAARPEPCKRLVHKGRF